MTPVLQEVSVRLIDCLKTRKRLRVLSLFDGIATGLYTLNELGFDVEVYFSSEIDNKAIRLQKHRFHDKIVMVGCVTKLTSDKLDAMGDIDLLLAGSPCQDLSVVNPARRGLYGMQYNQWQHC